MCIRDRLDDLVAMAAGAVIGVAGQLISDAVNRELSSWKDYGLAASACLLYTSRCV